MRSALAQRSWREITRRRARSAFTVVTLAAAIVGLWLFAVPSQMDAAMADRVATDRPQEVLLAPGGVRLTASEIAGLRRLPNVEGLEARATFWTRIRAGGEERDVWVVGVDDLAHQEVNVVSVVSGNAPRGAAYEALLDPQDRRSGRLDAGIGDVVEVLSADRRFVPLRISGTGQTLEFSSTVRDDDPVIYVPTRVVNELGGFSGYTRIELRLRSHDDVSVQATIGRVRGALTRIDPAVFYNRLPVIRAAGDWPGREDFRHFSSARRCRRSCASRRARSGS